MDERTEVQHFTRGQVLELLRGAQELVDELELPAELYPVAFRKAVELLAAKQVIVRPAPSVLGAAPPLR